MQWNSASEFFFMGGYALYVWGSFGISAAVMALEMWILHKQRAKLWQELRDQSPTNNV